MQALFDLAVRPEYWDELRQEISSVQQQQGEDMFSPSSINKLVKLDSFLKESQRHVAQNCCRFLGSPMSRLVLTSTPLKYQYTGK